MGFFKTAFLILLILSFVLSVPCGSYLPKDTTSCTASNTNDEYCCLLQTYINNVMVGTCYPIPKIQYLGLQDQMVLNDVTYSVDCGIEMGTNCGNIYSPKGYLDCGRFSTATSACCYWEYQGDTGCVWLGGTQAGVVEYKGLSIVCEAAFLKVGTYLFFIFIMILL
jgi:hypothetical protein